MLNHWIQGFAYRIFKPTPLRLGKAWECSSKYRLALGISVVTMAYWALLWGLISSQLLEVMSPRYCIICILGMSSSKILAVWGTYGSHGHVLISMPRINIHTERPWLATSLREIGPIQITESTLWLCQNSYGKSQYFMKHPV